MFVLGPRPWKRLELGGGAEPELVVISWAAQDPLPEQGEEGRGEVGLEEVQRGWERGGKGGGGGRRVGSGEPGWDEEPSGESLTPSERLGLGLLVTIR